MQGDDARKLLGFPSSSHPTLSEVKAAYKRKAWEFHPDRYPLHEKSHAESKFKLISEAYSFLQVQAGIYLSTAALINGVPATRVCFCRVFFVSSILKVKDRDVQGMVIFVLFMSSVSHICLFTIIIEAISRLFRYTQVVRTGVPRVYKGRSNHALVSAPFLLLILGTLSLGGFNASRAYQRQKEAYPSHNPFLP